MHSGSSLAMVTCVGLVSDVTIRPILADMSQGRDLKWKERVADNVMSPDMLKSFGHSQNAQNPGILEASLSFWTRELPLASTLSLKKWDDSHTKSSLSLRPL